MRAKSLRQYLAWFFALLTPLSTQAMTRETALKPNCGGSFQLCGYVDSTGSEQRIPQKFEVAKPFSEGLAAVRIDGLFGFIDLSGELVIAPHFEAASSFLGGYAEVRMNGASGAIDRSGKLVVPAQFPRVIHFSGGTFIVEPSPESSPPQVPPDDLDTITGSSTLTLLGPAGLYDRDRGWLTDRDLAFDTFDEPQRGLIWAGRHNQQGELQWGLLRADGNWQVSPRYEHVQRVMETHAVVYAPTQPDLPPIERRKTVRWGAVDRNGDLVVPLEFAHLSYWRGGYGFASEDKPYTDTGANDVKQGIVKSDGSLLAGRYFDEVDIREDGKLPRARIADKWFSVDPDGQLIPDQLDGVPLVECESGLVILNRGQEVEFMFPGNGRVVGRFDNTSSMYLEKCGQGPFAASRGNRLFFVLEDGTVLGGIDGFENTYSFSGNHAAVKVDGKWGIIDRSGIFTVQPRYAELTPDRNNTFAVGEGVDAYWIDAFGNRVDRPIAARPSPAQALTCRGGLRFFQQKGLWGLLDQDGQTVIEPRFRALSCFHEGLSWTAQPGDRQWCAVGPDGRRREAMDCRETYYPYDLSHSYPEKLDDDPFESSILWNRAWLDYLASNRDDPPRWVGDGVMSHGYHSVLPAWLGSLGD
ncbi:hypothetical protein DK847_19105 [Aestuariivirga litoralis]|uniref:WG repeat-containing protein n=1 Tax=Aestuariivirga litoralis TaxID=2650924 RepID=A0A2W2AP15_9HYPH|nr:WG repeat-containing protein [Aestuariivirga litoralis]PZF75322.1 hypothetical protein DK847_19105 [Aestuariivirga litoralis]